MVHDDSTFGLEPVELARLLSLGADDSETNNADDSSRVKLELLLDRLARKIPLEQALAQLLPEVFVRICKDLQPFAGHSFHALLNSPDTDVETLRRIKDYHKQNADKVTSQVERDVLAVIYHAAIACALIHHNQSISSFSYKRLADKYAKYLMFAWLTPDIRPLFERARLYCMGKLKQPE